MGISRRRFLAGLGAVAVAGAGLAAALQMSEAPSEESGKETIPSTTHAALETKPFEFRYETILENLEIPWSLAFAPDGRAFFTERKGRINTFDSSSRERSLFAEVAVEPVGEGGLLGLALSPDFEMDRFVYVYHTYRDASGLRNRVIRYKDTMGVGTNPQVIIDRIPGAGVHDGGRIRFGPDGMLYITTGDATQPSLAQDLRSLAGKILRVNPDGSIPNDNPFAGSPIYSYGHRNPQGIDWHPLSGKLYETEHGPSGEKGRVANDEINLTEAGKNYGWPEVVGASDDPRFVNPVFNTGDNETWAPSGCSFYKGDLLPLWKNSFFVATLRGIHLHRFLFDPQTGQIQASEKLLQGMLGRLRDVVQGPDGALYILTSNRDGRGSPSPNDDRIVRLVPA